MTECGCGAAVVVDVNGYRTDAGEVVCDGCAAAAAAVRRAGR